MNGEEKCKMKRPEILVVGSLVMDLIVRAKRFVNPGETIIGKGFSTASGGKGANQAVQAARLGAHVTMLGKVGDDAYGREMLASLKASGVSVDHVLVDADTHSAIGNVQIQEGEQGTQNRIVVVPGANMRLTVEDVAFLKDTIGQYDMAMLQLEISMEVNEAVAQYAHDAHVPVMLNPAPSAPLSERFLENIAYLSPNEHEAADLTGFAVDSEENCINAVRALRKSDSCGVLITRGEAGAVYGDGERTAFSPCVRCDRVADPTAAGDSFVAAFCVARCYGLSPEDAMIFANHTASLTVSKMGAQPSLPTIGQVLAYMKEKGMDTSVFEVIGTGDK